MIWKDRLKKYLVIAILSVAAELLILNYRAWFSLTATEQQLAVEMSGKDYYVSGMEGEARYIYIGVQGKTQADSAVLTTLTFSIRDEGSENAYGIGSVNIYLPVEKSKYVRIHSYGAMKELIITPDDFSAGVVTITKVIYDAKVPFFFSFPRMLLIFLGISLLGMIRPGSALYGREWKKYEKIILVASFMLGNMLLALIYTRSNPAFLHPVWPYHQQYHELAVALSKGQVSLDLGDQTLLEELALLSNPYDTGVRLDRVENAGVVWDIAYFKGKLYVYFGVVPVLLFYLPYYLIFHSAFPTWLGVFFAGCGAISGVYYLLYRLRKKYFPESPFLLYLIFSVIMSNSIHVAVALLRPDFYYLPIVLALAFSLWGLGLFLSALEDWGTKKKIVLLKLVLSAFCLALTAGCRPQFLIGSFLILPLLWPELKKESGGRGDKKALAAKSIAFLTPYVIVAAGMMAYNYARFGSVFDFGANYNLTTNDMTRRGFHLGRIPDGLFAYLLQFPVIKLQFPFVDLPVFYATYLGTTIKDWTYGGVLWTHMLLWSLLGIRIVGRELKAKKAYGFTVMTMAAAGIVLVADMEMSGIINRYYMDFLWLLMLAAVIVLYQLLERWKGSEKYSWLIRFILITGILGMLFEAGVTIHSSGLANDNIHRYYMLKAFFTFFSN